MNLSEYKKLKASGLIGIFGNLNSPDKIVQDGVSCFKKLPNYLEKELPMDIIMNQLTTPVDFKNIIILFTCGRYGNNRFFGKERILSDHCTFPITVKHILHKKGIKFKNNTSLISQKYIQEGMMMLVVQNGIAYAVKTYGDPTVRLAWDKTHKVELAMNDKVSIDDKNIMLSGFFVERFRNLCN